jgi:hypothetical protein
MAGSFMGGRGWVEGGVFRRKREVGEQRDAVGLGPDAHAAGFGERRILDLEEFRAVEEHREKVSGELHAQGVPPAGRHRCVRAVATAASAQRERGALAVNRLVGHDVVFEGVPADDVIVVGVARPEHEAAGLIRFAADRLEFHLGETVLHRRAGERGPAIRGLARLFHHERRGATGAIAHDFPLRRALAGDTALPVFRQAAGFKESNFGLGGQGGHG